MNDYYSEFLASLRAWCLTLTPVPRERHNGIAARRALDLQRLYSVHVIPEALLEVLNNGIAGDGPPQHCRAVASAAAPAPEGPAAQAPDASAAAAEAPDVVILSGTAEGPAAQAQPFYLLSFLSRCCSVSMLLSPLRL